MAKSQAESKPEQLLTIKEFSQQSRYSVTQIRRLVNAGRIPFLQPGGRGGRLLFQPGALLSAQEPHEPLCAEPKVRPMSGRKPKWTDQ
ncbi:MAG: hypothetical protein ACKVHE_26235 [Planctomycetales bacterium]|jgi:hypothetical protein